MLEHPSQASILVRVAGIYTTSVSRAWEGLTAGCNFMREGFREGAPHYQPFGIASSFEDNFAWAKLLIRTLELEVALWGFSSGSRVAVCPASRT